MILEKMTYNAKEAAKVLGIGTSKVYDLLHEGKIPHVKLGRTFIIPKQGLENWLQEQSKVVMIS